MTEEPIFWANSNATTADVQIIIVQSPEEFYRRLEK